MIPFEVETDFEPQDRRLAKNFLFCGIYSRDNFLR